MKFKVLLAMMAMAVYGSLAVSAQDIKPLRINLTGVSFGVGGSGIGIEYALPLDSMSLGLEGDVLYAGEKGNPWHFIGSVRLYPFSPLAKKFYTSLNYGFHTAGDMNPARQSAGFALGWRWIFIDLINLNIGLGAEYIMSVEPLFEPIERPIAPRVEVSLGIAL